jgi:Cu/Ag efflux pump CusA
MLYSRGAIDVVASLVLTAMVLALLIIPVYILWHLTRAIQSGKDTAIVMGILLVFTLIFSGALSLLTRAQRHEILASAAAYVISKLILFDSERLTKGDRYCAILVVFIGNVGQISPSTIS